MKYGGRVFIIKTSNFIESFTEWFSGTRESFRGRPLMLHMGLVGAIIWGKQKNAYPDSRMQSSGWT